jgi:hypothetical protein
MQSGFVADLLRLVAIKPAKIAGKSWCFEIHKSGRVIIKRQTITTKKRSVHASKGDGG